MRARSLRIVLTAWAVVIGLLACTAGARRTAVHRALRQEVVSGLRPLAEHGTAGIDGYLWGRQAEAIYLLGRGYGTPALERSLLLCEARRCYDWKYLYSSVSNHDLRTRLSARCLRAFADDPRVHWAAGQLYLAAGDFEAAGRELERALELAAAYPAGQGHPGGVRGFCGDTGISEQHLRGRFASALTLLGKWDEADQQAALAQQAGDGAPAPLAAADYSAEDWFRQQYPAEHASAAAARESAQRLQAGRERVLQAYLSGGAQPALRPLEEQLILLEQQAAAAPEQSYDLALELDELRGALLRAYLLGHDWQQAAHLLPGTPQASAYDGESLRQTAGKLLTRLAAGQVLGASAEAMREQRLAELRAEQPAASPAEWRWDLEYAEHGELAGLLEADYLPFLLRTDGFAAALAQSGRPLEEVLAEVRRAVQPRRGSYYDSSNGEPRWLAGPR